MRNAKLKLVFSLGGKQGLEGSGARVRDRREREAKARRQAELWVLLLPRILFHSCL